MTSLRFFWNGIKVAIPGMPFNGKLQKCRYHDGELRNFPEGTITVCADGRFSPEIGQSFTVYNDSDMMTDYFEDDRLRVTPSHPLYAEVKAAHAKQEAHNEKKREKRRGF